MSVKDRVEQKLSETGGLSSADLGSFTPQQEEGEEQPEKTEANLETTDIADVPEAAKEDVTMKLGEATDTSDLMMHAMQNDPTGVLFEKGQVELTPEDKRAFLASVVGDTRFERSFSLFDDSLKGVFRSRLNRETRAILGEMRRQLNAGEIETEVEYTTRMRHSILRFQLAELNGESYPIPEELVAKVHVEGEQKVVTPPEWVKEAEIYFQGHEAKTSAIYNALCVFEGKYWTLVENANNQDFWQTEDSTSE